MDHGHIRHQGQDEGHVTTLVLMRDLPVRVTANAVPADPRVITTSSRVSETVSEGFLRALIRVPVPGEGPGQ